MTPRAIRHYHDVGLLPEPARDASGYRRYQRADVVTLVRIRRLRGPGMPLDQIATVVRGKDGAARLPAALRALAADLDEEIARPARPADTGPPRQRSRRRRPGLAGF